MNLSDLNKLKEAFSFKDDEEKLGFEAEAIQMKIMSQVEELMKIQNVGRKEFAEKLGVTPAHITHLFTVDRNLNNKMLAKIQRALDVSFEPHFVSKTHNKKTYALNSNYREMFNLKQRKIGSQGYLKVDPIAIDYSSDNKVA